MNNRMYEVFENSIGAATETAIRLLSEFKKNTQLQSLKLAHQT
mgnify:CR=1 FL=1